jgi:hypothetical protein
MQIKKHTSVVTAGPPEAIRHSLHEGVTAYLVLSLVICPSGQGEFDARMRHSNASKRSSA